MEIPIFIILIVFLLLVACFVLFSIFLLYHAVRFGVASWANVLSLIVYIAVAILILMGSYSYVASVDWSQTIKIL